LIFILELIGDQNKVEQLALGQFTQDTNFNNKTKRYKKKPSKTSRKKVEAKIHSHIRLQSAEELLKRVDTGFGQKTRAPFQAIVEGVQNSADAIDKARETLLKSSGIDSYDAKIEVKIDLIDKSRGEILLSILDNGIGIPRGKIKIIVRAGGTGTIEYKASRSQQGIGWKAAAIYANQSTGKPLEIISKTFFEKKPHRHVYDYGKSKVTKVTDEDYDKEFLEHGTRMTIHLVGNYARAKKNILVFIKRMAAIHPYITFILKENGTRIEYAKQSEIGIPIPKSIPPHPNSVDVGQLKDLLAYQAKKKSISLAEFLKANFCKVSDKSINDLVQRVAILQYFDKKKLFAGDIVKCVAQSQKVQELKKDPKKVSAYLEKSLLRDTTIDFDYASKLVYNGKLSRGRNIRSLNNEDLLTFFNLNSLLKIDLPKSAFTTKTTVNMILNDDNKVRLLAEVLHSMAFPPPPVDSLMPIPRDSFIEGFTTIYKPDKYAYVERKPTSTYGKAIQVQVLALFGGGIKTDLKDRDKLIRIANCTPLVYEFGSDIITQTAREIDWSIYKLGKKASLPLLPVIFAVHVTSPQLKYLGVAKQAIGADDIIALEIKLALQAASRKLRKHVIMLEKSQETGKARKYLEKNAEIVARTLNKMLRVNQEKVHSLLMEEIHHRRPIYTNKEEDI
jgi:DNA topoisomerase-6 subunit B